MNSDIRVLSATPYFIECAARTPLKFGGVVVDAGDYAQVKVEVETRGGQRGVGWGGMFVMDFWAFPEPSLPHPLKLQAMKELTRRYCRLVAEHHRLGHPVDLYHETEDGLRQLAQQVSADLGLSVPMPFLGAVVCASPTDAAIHDAFGMVNGISAYDGYGAGFMAHDLSHYLTRPPWAGENSVRAPQAHVGREFAGRYIADYLRPAYEPKVPVFHLVGGLDKLRRAEVDDSDPQDGLPVSLDQWIERDGLFCLKVKLRGNDLEWDIARMLEVAAVAREVRARIGEHVLYFTADTNEMCESPDYIVEFLTRVREQEARTYDEILYVEQPTERDLAAQRFDMRPIAKLKPVLVDESLTGLADMELALELGWSGIALKACKCQSVELILAARALQMGVPYAIQDLTNPALALLHSVGMAARLHPIMGVEANSSQFFPAASEPEAAVHPGVFHRRDGMLDTSTLQGPGLGYQIERIKRALPEPW